MLGFVVVWHEKYNILASNNYHEDIEYRDYTPGIGKIVPRNLNNLNNKRLTTSEWPTKILTTLS